MYENWHLLKLTFLSQKNWSYIFCRRHQVTFYSIPERISNIAFEFKMIIWILSVCESVQFVELFSTFLIRTFRKFSTVKYKVPYSSIYLWSIVSYHFMCFTFAVYDMLKKHDENGLGSGKPDVITRQCGGTITRNSQSNWKSWAEKFE